MNRRHFLASLAGLPLVGSLASCGDDKAPLLAGGTSPNVLMIAVDDLNDWVGFLGGHPQVRTPNLDRLAAQSTVFERAYCNAPVCSPSRASALTGLLPQQTGIFFNSTSWRVRPATAVLLTDYLAAAGYETKIIGKVYHTYTTPPDPLPAATPASNLVCSGAPSLPPHGLFDWAPVSATDSEMPDHIFYEQAKAFLDMTHASPFFLNVGFLRTHVPWYVPQEYFDLYPLADIQLPPAPPDDLSDVPPAGVANALQLNFHDCITGQGQWAAAVRGYLASISFVDRQIGLLLDALEASAHSNNTVVVLWSDHGFHLGEKFHWSKLALWERATRIPFLVRKAGATRTPGRVTSSVSLVDLFPTLTDMCGIPTPGGLAGRSLAPLLDNPGQAWDHPVLTTNDQTNYAVRDNRWRYIRYANGDEELYDHDSDPGELTNLAGDTAYTDIRTRLGAFMPARA